MDKTYYIANWKMNGSKELVDEYIKYSSKYSIPKSSSVILCPPFTLLDYSKNKLPKDSTMKLGAQNISNVINMYLYIPYIRVWYGTMVPTWYHVVPRREVLVTTIQH